MILPPELLLDCLAGTSLPDTWRALQEPRGNITKLGVAKICALTPIIDPSMRRTMVAFTGATDTEPSEGIGGVPHEHGSMLVAVRFQGVCKHLGTGGLSDPRDSSLGCTLVRGEAPMAEIFFTADYDRSGQDMLLSSEWSRPAVLVPIPPRQTYYLRFYDPSVLRLADEPVEFWGWPLTPEFW